jgi:hypothetical protein
MLTDERYGAVDAKKAVLSRLQPQRDSTCYRSVTACCRQFDLTGLEGRVPMNRAAECRVKGIMVVSLWIVMTLVLLSVSLGCSDYAPTAQEWDLAMTLVCEQVGKYDFYSNSQKETTVGRLDFLRTNGKWFVCVVSCRGRTAATAGAYAGYWEDGGLVWNLITEDILSDASDVEHYDGLVARDSAWLIVDSVPFWEGDGIEELQDEAARITSPRSSMTGHRLTTVVRSR